jgi:hypothetical protein
MSAMPARVTEYAEVPRLSADRVPRRADRRAELKLARRERRRWSILSCSLLGGAFVLTVGILDVLH